MRTVPEIHTPPFRHTRFNIAFTPGTVMNAGRAYRKPAINHEACAFIENKRYRPNPARAGGMVNRNGGLVYQTDQVFVVYSPREEREWLRKIHQTKQYRVRRCPETSPLRCSPALPSFASVSAPPQRSTAERANPMSSTPTIRRRPP